MGGKVSYESRKKYEDKVYDKIYIRLRKDEFCADHVRAAAERVGESVNAYIVGAIRERMEREEAEA